MKVFEEIQGEGEGEEEQLVFEDKHYHTTVLSSLNSLRREGEFCDVKLVVEAHDICAHKVILASSSRYFMNLFTNNPDFQQSYKLRDLEYTSFSSLLDFIYTGRIEIPPEDVKQVYRTATQLKLDSVIQACGDYLACNLKPDNCLGIRQFADDENLKQNIDLFIDANVSSVAESKYIFELPRIQAEIIGADSDLLSSTNEKHLFELVLNWAKTAMLSECGTTLDTLTDQVNVLYLSADNALLDCKDVDESNVKQDGAVVDYTYKKSKSRKSAKPQEFGVVLNDKKQDSAENGHSPPVNPVRKFCINPENCIEKEWSNISSIQTGDKTFMSIAIINGQVMTLQIHFRTTPPSPTFSDGSDAAFESASAPAERLSSLNPLESMTSPRCAFGLDVLNDQLFACGGYDRGECLKTCELYDKVDNSWTLLPDMNMPRGRFKGAVVDGKWYSCGGCNGQSELSSVECYDPTSNSWSTVSDLPHAKSSPGVVSMNGKLYCIGGCYGQDSVNTCEMYDPKTDKWTIIAPLNIARSQCGVCALNGMLFVVGGTDCWNVLNSMEIYDPATGMWEIGPTLNIPRRGAGLVAFRDKVYVIGGSDGVLCLNSTELYDLKVNKWVFGVEMSKSRANAGVAVLEDTIYAVGGFSGKKFLHTMECFNPEANEWHFYMSMEDVARSSADESDSQKINGRIPGTKTGGLMKTKKFTKSKHTKALSLSNGSSDLNGSHSTSSIKEETPES